MERAAQALERVERVGGHPVLDFVNTVQSWQDGRPGEEYLADFPGLARWHEMVGLLDGRALRPLRATSAVAGGKAWRQALAMRGGLYRILAALAAGRAAPQEDLDALHAVMQRTLSYRRPVAEGRLVAVRWNFAGAPATAILGPIAWSAADLLERGPLDRLKACPPGDGCGWLFLDLSKNRSRTWCSMKTCGNAAKVRRFRTRS